MCVCVSYANILAVQLLSYEKDEAYQADYFGHGVDAGGHTKLSAHLSQAVFPEWTQGTREHNLCFRIRIEPLHVERNLTRLYIR